MKAGDEHSNQKLTVSGKLSTRDDDLLQTPEDAPLLERISDYFKGYHDIEEVINDPSCKETCELVTPMISEFVHRKSHDNEIRNYIFESLAKEDPYRLLNEEVIQIKQEIKDKNLDNISAEWVKEWHERKQKEENKTQEIRDFVTGALETENKITGINYNFEAEKLTRGKSSVIRYSSVAAAAIIAFAFLIRYFIPSGNPEKIFTKYYEPYYAASLVTRSTDGEGDESLRSALECYKSGNYQLAAVEFSNALLSGPVTDLPRFYLGVTFIELNNYDRAVRLLEPLAGRPGEFTKDAKWYLGLVSLKTGNKEKAFECFDDLARNPGFYTKRSEKILRFLK